MKLLENFWLKIIALIMGMLIWFHVATDKTYNYEFYLPVVQVDLADSLTLAKNPPDSILVAVSAQGKQLLRGEWVHEGIRINAIGLGPGQHQVPLSTSNSFLIVQTSDVTLEEIIMPNLVDLHVDQIGERVVQVTADLTAEADDGFAVSLPYLIEPAEVTLRGAQSLLSRFGTVLTEQRKLTGLRTDVDLRLALTRPPSFGITLQPDSVTVSLQVIPVKTRVFENIPVVIYNRPPNMTLTTNPTTVTVELTGPPDDIDQLDRGLITASVDFRQTNEFGEAPLSVDHPTMFNLRNASTATVKLIVEESPATDADNRN